jgi:SNF2 family DNA or RNA helicase
VNVQGSDSPEQKVQAILDFIEGRIRVLVSKPSIFGLGLNLQCCSRMIFLGLSDSYEEFYQSLRRVYRFGQKRPVEVHIVISALEGAVLANIRRKEQDAERMAQAMVANMASLHGVSATKRTNNDYLPAAELKTPAWLWSNQ